MEYMTSKSYRNATWECEPFEQDGKMYVNIKDKCYKCGGKGYINYYSHIYNGVCYDCNGAGFFHKTVRVYTEKEIAAQERVAIRKEENRLKNLEERAETDKAHWFEKNGFNKDGVTYCIGGGDTFEIKTFLKDAGCKFNNTLKWHNDSKIELPNGYTYFEINFDDIYEWNIHTKSPILKEDAEDIIASRFNDIKTPSVSDYIGEIGERIRDIEVTYKGVRGYSSKFGWTNIYTFKYNENILTWFTAKDLDIENNTILTITATVKNHEEFNGQKTTQLSRVVVKVKE